MLKVGAGYIQCLQSRRENSILSCPGTLHFQHRFGIPWIEMWKDAVRVLYTFCVWVTGWQTGKEWQEKEEYRRTRTRRWMKTRRRIICNFGHLQLLVICGYWWLQVIWRRKQTVLTLFSAAPCPHCQLDRDWWNNTGNARYVMHIAQMSFSQIWDFFQSSQKLQWQPFSKWY